MKKIILILVLFFSLNLSPPLEAEEGSWKIISGNKQGEGYNFTWQDGKKIQFNYDQLSRNGHYLEQKEEYKNFAGQWVIDNVGKFSLSSKEEKEQDRLGPIFTYPQQRSYDEKRYNFAWKEYNFFWIEEKKGKNTDWWPELIPDSTKTIWSDYQRNLVNWGIEYKKKYSENPSLKWTEQIKWQKEKLDYSIKNIQTGDTLANYSSKSLEQFNYLLQREEKRGENLFSFAIGGDYNSIFNLYPHLEAGFGSKQLSFAWKSYHSLPGAKKLWDMPSTLYIASLKRYSVYKSSSNLQPEKRDEFSLLWQPNLGDSCRVNLKLYKWRLEDYIAYQRESYPQLSLRQYGNYPLVDWQGVDLNLEKKLARYWKLDANYSYSDVRNRKNDKMIPYKAFHKLDWQLDYEKKKWQLGVGGNYVGDRYYNDTNTGKLKPYHLVFSALNYKSNKDTELSLRVDNITSKLVDDGDTVWYDPIYTFSVSKHF